MSTHPAKPARFSDCEDRPARVSLRHTVFKSLLLNVAIVLTSFPVLVFAGGPGAVVPALAVMAGITFLIWGATFALFSFVSLARILTISGDAPRPLSRGGGGNGPGVADRWLDGHD